MFPITQIPTPELHKPSRQLTKEELLSKNIQKLITQMIPTMHKANGIGLAAPQVAIPTEYYKKIVSVLVPQTPARTEPKVSQIVYPVNLQICIIGKDALMPDFTVQSHDTDLVLVNPTLKRQSRRYNTESEGCLSILGKSGTVRRIKNIQVNAWNRYGTFISFYATNFFAQVCQHEIDHLNGILYIDRAKEVHTTRTQE